MNILTFDIEEWYLQKAYFGNHSEMYKVYDYYLEHLLNVLDERNIKGTFFCVGGMAINFPDVIKKIENRGHEIGCHSFKHAWLNTMTREEVMEDTRTSIDALEQCIGRKVKSYRAPAFSIGNSNKWTFNILADCGIERDASVFPAVRDFGGFAQFGEKKPTLVHSEKTVLREFPICTAKLLGHKLAYSGGGYFRFFPLWFVRREMAKSDYSMTYFHIGDLIPETSGIMSKANFESYFKIPGTLKNRYLRYIKSNLGKKKAFAKLLNLVATEDFVNLEQADKMIDWTNAPSIIL